MLPNQEPVWHAHRLAIPLAVAALMIATYAHAVVLSVPKATGGASRAIVTGREWDISEDKKQIPEWLVLLSREPTALARRVENMEQHVACKYFNGGDLDPYINYYADGNFLGFGILYETSYNYSLMVANIEAVMAASNDKTILGFGKVHEQPRLAPTNASWHCLQDGFQWYHLFTFGTSGLGIFRLQYEPWKNFEQMYSNVLSIKNMKYNTCKQPASVLTVKPPERESRGMYLEGEDGGSTDTDGSQESTFRPRKRRTTTSSPTTTTRSPYDDYGIRTPPPRPDKWWRQPTWEFTNPGVNSGGRWVYPERPLLESNCWAYSYASYHDGMIPNARGPAKPRFWARWPVKPVKNCYGTRPFCYFTFDRERAIQTGEDPKRMRPQAFPCYRWQDEGAPIFCSEDKVWSDQNDMNKMELSYMIHRDKSQVGRRIITNCSEISQDFAYDCYKEAREEFRAFNMQNLSFILKNPLLLDWDIWQQ